MNLLRRAWLRLRAILARRALENDMTAEMRDHLAQATERFVARGMSAEDARLVARREFGNLTVLEEQSRDARGQRWVEALMGDLQFAFRYFARHKATTAIIVAVLTLGTGANTMIFSLFQSEFLRPAPAVPEDDAHARIVALERATRTGSWQPRAFTNPERLALAERREIFSTVAAWTEHDVVLGGDDSTVARRVGAQFVTPNYFAALGLRLAAGQGFAQGAADSPDMTVVLSHRMAELLYRSAAGAVGRRILVNEVPLYVVGVAPVRFQGALRNMDDPELWIPLTARADIARIPPRWIAEQPALELFARLAPLASREQATGFVQHVIANTLPDSATRVGMARTAHVVGLHERPPGEERQEMILAVAFIISIGTIILLVGWMNVSSLMVAAAVGRRHEIAVRLSLGASRVRLLRQLVTESTVLALLGGALGLTLASWFLIWNQKTEIEGVTITPDLGTFAFVLLLAVATGILFGLSPALHATRGAVSNALRDSRAGTSGRARLQRGFVVAQIMLSQPLLVMLGTMLWLMIGDYQPLSRDTGKHVIAVGLRPLMTTGAPGQRGEAVDSLVPSIARRPEVLGAVPDATGFDIRGVIAIDRQRASAVPDSAPRIVDLEGAAPGWFALLDVPIVLGRDVALADTAATNHPIVIGSDFARVMWGDANPIGRTLASPPVLPGQDSIAMTVVGVYDATRRLPRATWNGFAAQGTPMPSVYTAYGKHWQRDRILVRPRGSADAYIPELQRLIRTEAPSLPVTSMQTLAQIDAQAYRDTMRTSMLAGAGGVVALLLASLGLYGVVSLAVQQRTREIGIRIAVGAHPGRVTRMFLASGVRIGVIALLLGLPLSVAGLYIAITKGLVIAPGVNPLLVGGAIAAILLGVAAAATWMPARRASLVDPATTLRAE